jgi:hypothetical protein
LILDNTAKSIDERVRSEQILYWDSLICTIQTVLDDIEVREVTSH